MNKLLKFKEYVTIAQAAKHLSKMLGEEVNETDVIELISDGHLTASVVANDWAVYFPQERIVKNITVFSVLLNGKPDDYISGIYPIRPEDIDVSQEKDSTFVLEEDYPRYLPITLSDGRLAYCYEIKDNFEIRETNREEVDVAPPPDSMTPLEAMRKSLEALDAWEELPIPSKAHKRPSTTFNDLVIRTFDLLEFVAKANDIQEKPLDYRERESMERIILVLAKGAGYDLREPFKAAAALQTLAARVGVELPKSKDNIAGKLKAAARHDIYG